MTSRELVRDMFINYFRIFEKDQEGLADCPAYLRNLAFRYNCPAAGSCSVADRFRLAEPDTVRHLQEACRHR